MNINKQIVLITLIKNSQYKFREFFYWQKEEFFILFPAPYMLRIPVPQSLHPATKLFGH